MISARRPDPQSVTLTEQRRGLKRRTLLWTTTDLALAALLALAGLAGHISSLIPALNNRPVVNAIA
jgi:hypothetical protein